MAGVVLPWLWAFLFTEAVEVPIWAYALRKHARREGEERLDPWACVALGFGASAITHPIVWFVFPRLAPGSYWVMTAQAEAFAVLVEAAYASYLGLPSALAWSILANAMSLGLGLTSRAAFGWP
jgi:hypothetical protein